MAAWAVEFSARAEADFARLDRTVRRRILLRIEWLSENFDTIVPLPLSGEFQDFYKLRVGNWRVVYTVAWNKNMITVHYIDKRDKIYKRK
ncbi:MAG: type II toxin-antitoxin system RelE/ParE family toxin [Patescibacteria group bacterium]